MGSDCRAPEADKLIENYRRVIDLTRPEIVPYPEFDCGAERAEYDPS